MSIFAISKAISARTKQSTELSTLKHAERINEVKSELAIQSAIRMDKYTRILADKRIAHSQYLAGLTKEEMAVYDKSEADLRAALGETKPT